MEKEREEENLLVVIIDLNAQQKHLQSEGSVTLLMEPIINFVMAFMSLSSSNHLAVIGCHDTDCKYLYSEHDMDNPITFPGNWQYDLLSYIGYSIRKAIKKIVSSLHPSNDESQVAGACSLAMCYINRKQTHRKSFKPLVSRILIVSGGPLTKCFIPFINAFTAAKKRKVTIDAACIGDQLHMLSIGANMTDGVYMVITKMDAFLPYMLHTFLPSPSIRNKLFLPSIVPENIIACHCHSNLINIGYICNSCGAVYCKIQIFCKNCHQKLKLPLRFNPDAPNQVMRYAFNKDTEIKNRRKRKENK